MELALIHRRTPFISLQRGRSVSTVFNGEKRLVVIPWWLWGSMMGVKRTLIHVAQGFSDAAL